MAFKDWCENFQPIQLYIILILTVIFFITELIFSHTSHALTLLMDSYHMLCNILALTGCLIAIKYGKSEAIPNCLCDTENEITKDTLQSTQEKNLKNTFGWTRIDVISMLVCCIFHASLSISVLVEALQTLVHIDHLDAMHHPLIVLIIGGIGLLLNGTCYLLIGGYTFHQGSFMYITESGEVVLSRILIPDMVRKSGRRLSRTRTMPSTSNRQRQGCREMLRDVLGGICVILSSLLVYLTDTNIAKFVDPIVSLISAISLMFLSFPYLKESCLILLQTIPESMNIDVLKQDLLKHFPEIESVHDFHVWQLTASKVISTVHIIFTNNLGYEKIMQELREYFLDNGITQVTIQPEFLNSNSITNENSQPLCLMKCQGEGCKLSHCCPDIKQ